MCQILSFLPIINIKTLSSVFCILFHTNPPEIWPISAWTQTFQVLIVTRGKVDLALDSAGLTLNVEVKEYDQQIKSAPDIRVPSELEGGCLYKDKPGLETEKSCT